MPKRSIKSIARDIIKPLCLLGEDEATAIYFVSKAIRTERAAAMALTKERDFFADLFSAARAAGEVHFECSGCGWISNPEYFGQRCRKCSGRCIAVSTKDHPAKVELSNWQARAASADAEAERLRKLCLQMGGQIAAMRAALNDASTITYPPDANADIHRATIAAAREDLSF